MSRPRTKLGGHARLPIPPGTVLGSLVQGSGARTQQPTPLSYQKLAYQAAATALVPGSSSQQTGPKLAATAPTVGSTSPGATSSTSYVCAGLAQSFTPNALGHASLFASGSVRNDNNSGGGQIQLIYGTGTAPTNGASPPAGSHQVGSPVLAQNDGSKPTYPWHCHAVVTGLTAGTTYWLDVAFQSVSAGNTTLSGVCASAHEL